MQQTYTAAGLLLRAQSGTDRRTNSRQIRIYPAPLSALRCCLDRCHTCNFIARLYRAIKSQRATVQLHVTNQANMIGYDIHTNSLVLVRVYNGSMGHEPMGQMGQFWMGHMGHGSMHFTHDPPAYLPEACS